MTRSVPTLPGTPTSIFNVAAPIGVATLSVPKPSGLLAGDYVVIVFRSQSSAESSDVTSPGFTNIFTWPGASSGLRLNQAMYKKITNAGSEPAAYDVSFTATNSTRRIAAAFIVRGADQTTFIDNKSGASFVGGNIASGYRPLALTITDSPVLEIVITNNEWSGSTPTSNPAPAAFTQLILATTGPDTGSRTSIQIASRTQSVSPTLSGTAQDFNTVGTATVAGANFTIKGADGGASVVGVPVWVVSGAGTQTAKTAYGWDGTAAKSLTALRRVQPGAVSVAAMLAKTDFTVAHRGGSTNWPEMSLYAYTQAAIRGVDALEVSLAITSDGVLFGMHDQYLDRTSAVTGSINPQSMTWATLNSTYNIVIGAEGAPKPYMTFDQILAAYGQTHILFVDPKYAGASNYATVFAKMLANDPTKTRTIAKYYGAGATWLSQAKAAGWMTWGYFYDADYQADTTLPLNMPNVDIWGMDYNAPQATWDAFRASGKPGISHTEASLANYNTGVGKGASGHMISGVKEVMEGRTALPAAGTYGAGTYGAGNYGN